MNSSADQKSPWEILLKGWWMMIEGEDPSEHWDQSSPYRKNINIPKTKNRNYTLYLWTFQRWRKRNNISKRFVKQLLFSWSFLPTFKFEIFDAFMKIVKWYLPLLIWYHNADWACDIWCYEWKNRQIQLCKLTVT